MNVPKGSRDARGGMIDPFPTIFRDVSGKTKAIIARHIIAAIVRNQNIHVQPAPYVRALPRIGPMLGAMVTLV